MHKHHPEQTSTSHKKTKFINRIIFIVAAVQPLGGIPQVYTIFKHQDATGLSITSWIIYVLFDLAWLWYGISNRQKAVIISATLFSIIESIVIVGALLFGGTWI